ncbi:MAG: SDR family oxidoreductase [Oscillospiraceae bacterium]|nr:SDR family oxidoreductase [Oscillospiraceae bacterium]
MKRLENKVVIVTGATSGIGKAQAIVMAKEGARVVCGGRNAERMDLVLKTIKDNGDKATGLISDVSRNEDCVALAELAIKTYGTVDVLCNTAGVFDFFKKTLDQTPEGWDEMLDVDVKGVFMMTRACLPEMLKKKSGVIINISSIAGLNATDGGVAYVTAKHAVNGYTKQLCIDHAQDGIRANSLCVGMCKTPLLDEVFERDPRERTKVLGLIPCNFLGTGEDVAYLSVFLSTDEAKWINGSVISIDGGQNAKGC